MRGSIQNELIDLWQRCILPGLVVGFPARLSGGWLSFLARHSLVVEEACQAAWRGVEPFACELGVGKASFIARHRLYWLFDFADLFLLKTRTNKWINRHVYFEGVQLPDSGEVMLLTFHFGAGMWAMRVFGQSNLKVSWLHAPVEGVFAKQQKVLSWLGRQRIDTVGDATGFPAIPTGGSYARMADWIDNGGSITALVDAPHSGLRNTSPAKILGQSFYMANGLARLAKEKNCPVFFYTTSLAENGYDRRLYCEGPFYADSEDMLIQAFGIFMDKEIRRDPAAWHLWSLFSQFGNPSEK